MTGPLISIFTPPVKARCVACKEPIGVGATICKECKSDQAQWRNELKFWAGMAGIVTLIASGVAFTTNLAAQFWQRYFGQEIAVTNLDAFGKTVLWNLTSQPIYLKSINISSTAPVNDLVWEIHQTIQANGKHEVELLKVAEQSWHGENGNKFGKPPSDYAQLDQSAFAALLQNMSTETYVPTFLIPESESYAQLARFLGKKFQTFSCDAKVMFVRLSDGSSGSKSVSCKGAFRYRRKWHYRNRLN